MAILDAIKSECEKLIRRHHGRIGGQQQVQERFAKATGQAVIPRKPPLPPHWAAASWFNPFLVRKSAAQAAHAIDSAIRLQEYRPKPALILQIAKPDGGTRAISIYPVADSAIANHYYKQILRRNQSRLSPFSYAYRSDVGIQDVIERLWREHELRSHYHVVEYDFSKYFDTINHDYIRSVINKYFRITNKENIVINALLESRRAYGLDNYRAGRFTQAPHGIPQGNSLSLFLANVACHELDLDLTRNGMLFARYADDIVILSPTQTQAELARELIMTHSARAGLSINFSKSPGISEVGPQGIRDGSSSKVDFHFLGHTFSHRPTTLRGLPASAIVRRLSIRPRTYARLKSRVANIIHSHLLRYPEKKFWQPHRVDVVRGIDWDLVTCINDLRGYIYGDLPEDEIRMSLRDRQNPLHIANGYMAFFPLINDIEQLKALDGWLLNAVFSATKKRALILSQNFSLSNYPNFTKTSLLSGSWYDSNSLRIENDVRLPSFVRAWKYAKRGLAIFGLRQYPERRREAEQLYK